MFSQKCFSGAFETKGSVKSAFQVLLRLNAPSKVLFMCICDEMLGDAFKLLWRRNVSVKSPFNVLLRRNVRSKVLSRCFSGAFKKKCSVKSVFKVLLRRNARSKVLLKCI